MEQVPTPSGYGLVGRGRAATHLSRYFTLLGVPHRNWSRADGAEAWNLFTQNCSTVFLLISDDALESFVEARPELTTKTLIHFSGARTFKEFHGFHPLVSFGPALFDLSFYESIYFIGEQGRPSLRELVPELPNRFATISAQEKALYHALCVLSGNFTNILWAKLFTGLADLKVPGEAALPYLHSVVENISRHGSSGLTGPLARRDLNTLRSNLNALEGDPFADIYRSFLKAKEISL